jgi:hypothetical protein
VEQKIICYGQDKYLCICEVKRLTGYVTGTVKKPEATAEKVVELQKWEADDGQIMSWLINSMEVRL